MDEIDAIKCGRLEHVDREQSGDKGQWISTFCGMVSNLDGFRVNRLNWTRNLENDVGPLLAR